MGLQKNIEAVNKKLELLNKVAKATSSTLGLRPRLDYICSSIKELMGVKGVTLRLLDERTNKLELVSSCGLSRAYLRKGPVDADRSLARALRGEPHLVLDVTTDPSIQYPGEAMKEGLVSVLSYPLKGREKVIGTLRLYTGERREFSQEEMALLSALAGQGAIFIENAKIYDALEKQDEAKNEFILLMTHELKGPLMAIQGFLEVMLKGYVGTLTEKQIEIIERIEGRIESVLGISTGLLDIYQWQSKGGEVRQRAISLNQQIQRAVDLFKAMANEKGLTLTFQLPEEDVTLTGTEEELEKIFNNLISNAIKYTPSGGRISISLSTLGSRIELRIKDTGIGISSEDMPRIFREFYRSKGAKKMDPNGRGLGLAFVKKIVESLGGVITVNSEEGKGTEFVILFLRT
jgi:signal transduction histidine kinase